MVIYCLIFIGSYDSNVKFRSALSGAVTLFGGLAISKALTKGYGGVDQALAST